MSKHTSTDEDLSHLDRDTRSNIKRHKKLLKAAIGANNHDEASKLCNALGEMFGEAEMWSSALQYHMQDLEISTKHGSKISIAIAHRMVGEVYCWMGEYEAAVDHQKKYLKMSLEEKDLVEEQRAYTTLGRTCYIQMMSEPEGSTLVAGMRKQTGDYYYQAINLTGVLREKKLVPEREVLEMRCRLYLNIGLLYDKHNPSMSLEYLEKARARSKELRDWHTLHLTLTQLVETHTRQNDFNQALRYADQAVQAAKMSDIKANYSQALTTLSLTHLAMDNMVMAQGASRQALHLDTSMNQAMLVYKCSKLVQEAQQEDFGSGAAEVEHVAKIGTILTTLSMPQQALSWLERQLQMEQDNEFDSLSEIHGKLASCHSKLEDFDLALHYYKEQLGCTEDTCLVWVRLARLYLQYDHSYETCFDAAQAGECEAKTGSEQAACYKAIIDIADRFDKKDVAENARKELAELELDETQTLDSQAGDGEDISDIDVSDEEEVEDKSKKSTVDKKLSKVNHLGETPLQQAAIAGNESKVRELLSKHASPHTRDNAGWTPLHEACNHGFLEIVEMLVEAGADINDRGGSKCGGITPLHDAVTCNFADIVNLLLSRGANVLAKDEEQLSCLDKIEDQLTSEPDDHIKTRIKDILEEAIKNPRKVAPSKRVDVSELFDTGAGDTTITSGPPVYKAPPAQPTQVNRKQSSQINRTQSSQINRSKSLPLALSRDKPMKSKVRYSETPPADNWVEEVNSSKRRKVSNPFTEKRKSSFSNKKVLKQSKLTATIMSDDSEASPPLQLTNTKDEPKTKLAPTTPTVASVQIPEGKIIRVKVRVSDKLFLIPVQSKQTISELALSAATRYHAEVGLLPRLKLTTSDGALLADSDPAALILNDGEEVVGVMEELERQPLPEQYKIVCERMGLEPMLLQKLSSNVLDVARQNVDVIHMECLLTTILCFTPLTEINISNNRLTPELMNSLCAALPTLPALTSLDVSCCSLGPKSFVKLCDTLSKPCEDEKLIRKFSCDNNLYPDGIENILKLAVQLSLEHLSARSCHLSGSISPALSSQLASCKLVTLDLRHNNIPHIPSLPSSLKHLYLGSTILSNPSFPPSLTSLALDSCELTDSSVITCLAGLSSITSLSLCYNNITSAECVVEVLMSCPGLTHLDLSGNAIGSAGVEEIGLVAPNTLSVVLQGCGSQDISSDSLTMLANDLKACDLSYNDVNFPRLCKGLDEGVRAKFICRGNRLSVENC